VTFGFAWFVGSAALGSLHDWSPAVAAAFAVVSQLLAILHGDSQVNFLPGRKLANVGSGRT
jgi:hypothetical protein